MSDYTPTTEEVQDSYRFSNQRPDVCGKDFGAEFDRWLAEVERAAAEKALTDAADALVLPKGGPAHYVDVWWAEEEAIDYLRARAEAYRKGQGDE